jgi:hypothetical protein
VEQDECQAVVDRLLDDPARRAGRDERGHQDIGVAGDAQGLAPPGPQLVDQGLAVVGANA